MVVGPISDPGMENFRQGPALPVSSEAYFRRDPYYNHPKKDFHRARCLRITKVRTITASIPIKKAVPELTLKPPFKQPRWQILS